MDTVMNGTRMNYKTITHDLLMYGKEDLPKWDKEEFVIVCMYDYNVCKRTAEKVYNEYHKAIKALNAE